MDWNASPQNACVEALIPSVTVFAVIMEWRLKEIVNMGPWSNRIRFFIRRDKESSLSLSLSPTSHPNTDPYLSDMWGHSEKGGCLQARKRVLPNQESKLLGTLILDFLPPEYVKTIFCYLSHLLNSILLRQPEQTKAEFTKCLESLCTLSVIQEEGGVCWLRHCNSVIENSLWYPQAAPFCIYNVLICIQR